MTTGFSSAYRDPGRSRSGRQGTDQVALPAGDSHEPILSPGPLAELGDPGTAQCSFGDMGQMFRRDVDRLVEPAEADQQIDQDLRRQGGVDVVRLGRVQLGPEVGDRRVVVLSQQGSEVDAMVVEGPLEGRMSLELEPRREPAAVLGQIERPAPGPPGRRPGSNTAPWTRGARCRCDSPRREKSQSRPSTSLAIEVPSGGRGCPALGDVGPDARDEMIVEPANQPLDAATSGAPRRPAGPARAP